MHDALYNISYANALLYSRAMPLPGDKTDTDAPLYDERKDANNPDLFKDFTQDEEVVRQ